MTGEQAQGYAVAGVALFALFAVYKVYKTGESAVSAVSKTVADITDTVSTTVGAAKRIGEDAYAETRSFFTGPQMYSPTALDGSMSRMDAIQLSKEIDAMIIKEDALRVQDSHVYRYEDSPTLGYGA